MEYYYFYSNKKPLLALLIVSCLLLLPIVSSRSLSLRSHQHPSSVKVSAQTKVRNLKGITARMDVEVNDYPGSGPNNRHDPPKGPGRV